MTAITGWLIICTGLGLLSAALLWPAYRLARPRFASRVHARWAYLAASAAGSIVLWYLIPLVVWALFGRTAH